MLPFRNSLTSKEEIPTFSSFFPSTTTPPSSQPSLPFFPTATVLHLHLNHHVLANAVPRAAPSGCTFTCPAMDTYNYGGGLVGTPLIAGGNQFPNCYYADSFENQNGYTGLAFECRYDADSGLLVFSSPGQINGGVTACPAAAETSCGPNRRVRKSGVKALMEGRPAKSRGEVPEQLKQMRSVLKKGRAPQNKKVVEAGSEKYV
ncbi:hypothetical protein BDY24DRAFT_432924 [Mrakia frigida]|uniref:uncharacterized protein n=1 Tax=Mrakia frigida TaxID=29902 RepID=UPI003FCBF672